MEKHSENGEGKVRGFVEFHPVVALMLGQTPFCHEHASLG